MGLCPRETGGEIVWVWQMGAHVGTPLPPQVVFGVHVWGVKY